jgi:ppGpp synthetase/RelA/SpoT-type nucleotidyltranferase
MKISGSIRTQYDRQLKLNEILQARVHELFGSGNNGRWFFKSRVKQEESFAQKIETGRFYVDKLEDFFACTLVVENRSSIAEAIELVAKYCVISYQRPRDFAKTHKEPENFPFDDLRLYVYLKPPETTESSDIHNVLFEFQIKTFLQYAWGIATHDLVYKGDSVSWAKARLAYQIKAMLEHAEISIEQVDSIALSPSLSITDGKTLTLVKTIKWLQEIWSTDMLPKDLVRLSETIIKLLTALKLDFSQAQHAVRRETQKGGGAKLRNLSPYEIIVKSIASNYQFQFHEYISCPDKQPSFRILITPEMEIFDLPAKINKGRLLIIDS